MKKFLMTLTVLGVAAFSANASVSIIPTVGDVYANNGSTLLSTNSLVAFIADVDGDGFGNWGTTSLGGTGFTIDDDDILLGIGASGEAADGWIVNTYEWANVANPNVQGKAWAMLWFDTPYVDGATGAGDGVNYGVYETGEIVPNDGVSGEEYYFMTQSEIGSLADNTFYANYTTGAVPEPLTVTLLLVGGGLIAARRNAKRRAA